MLQFNSNPDSRMARGISQGFQRQVLTTEPSTQRDFLRITLSSTAAAILTEPIEKHSIGNFRSDAVTAVLEHAVVNRTSSGPVLIHLGAFQQNCVALNPVGAGVSMQHDTCIGCVTPNTGNSYRPTPDSCGAQIALSNILGQQLSFALTDTLGNAITDLQSFYISICFFERIH